MSKVATATTEPIGRVATPTECEALIAALSSFEPVKIVPEGYVPSKGHRRDRCHSLRVVTALS